MPVLKIQLTHPGVQKKFNLKTGYRQVKGRILREWNNDPIHYRKFIINPGDYLNGLKDKNPKKAALAFWGEWEGNSFFKKLQNGNANILPNGIHRLIHSTVIRGGQNTDPYIYGSCFKYCICKQKGQMSELDPGSLILFGSVFPSLNKFYIDTIFVVKKYSTAVNVQKTRAQKYTAVYKEETLEQLEEYLGAQSHQSLLRLYHSLTWWDNSDYFSFVPCRLGENNQGFERFFLELNDPKYNLSSNPTGISYLSNCSLTSKQAWHEIAETAVKQGFNLGIRFTEPEKSNFLTNLLVDKNQEMNSCKLKKSNNSMDGESFAKPRHSC